ncbi:GNAT family N-acetyltransferase [Actinopolymorpha pittospori]|uniref:RimJ/RimL family protein N-acetyltransferase n=1 Tax=Actinopolymorpha pittospori TaxID=648752 RepID=A0A927RET8_9ACTN|nr:RimJ/RimL family protein N-acetyltransferase [Actinopolymorpha pittospori]
MTLAGPRVMLREFRADDASAVFAYASDPVVSAYVPWDTHADIEVTRGFLSGVLASADAEERTRYELAVTTSGGAGRAGEDGEEARLIGAGRISVQDARHRRGSIGYVLAPDYWSKGIGTEVAHLLLAFGFERLNLHRIEATAHPDNIGSQRVFEKVGMKYEGRIRDHLLFGNGWRDSLSYAILEGDPRPAAATRP